MVTYRTDRLNAVAGVRYEHTDFNSGTRGDSDNDVDGGFDKLLPSVNVSYEIGDNVFLRGGYSRTLGRPNPADLTVVFSETLPGTPNLDCLKSVAATLI